MEKLILSQNQAPGDITVMTAAVRDLHLTYPGRFLTDIDTTCKDIWKNNPYVVRLTDRTLARRIKLNYGAYMYRSSTPNMKMHFLEAFHKDLGAKLSLEIPLHLPKPDLYLSEKEANEPHVAKPYWVIMSGGKSDVTIKHWIYRRHQEVVDILGGFGLKFVQLGDKLLRSGKKDGHPPLDNVLNLIGKTNLREMISIIAHSEGVICTITSAMHMAAAFDKPCVVTAGGREEWWWEGYHKNNVHLGKCRHSVKVSHRYLHTIGKLDCCLQKGCWKNKVTRDEEDKHKLYCKLPVVDAASKQQIPKCMEMVTSEDVVKAVLSYYLDGTLTVKEGMVIPDLESSGHVKTLDGRLAKINLELLPDDATSLHYDDTADAPACSPPTLSVPTTGGGIVLPKAADYVPPKPVIFKDYSIMDNPAVGGKMTMFVLLYGNYPEMHRKCLNSILATTPPEKVELRVGSNELCQATLDLVEKISSSGRIVKHYRHVDNRKKYPVQREMWYDETCPVSTKWLIWFDDDTICDRRQDWLLDLCNMIVKYPEAAMIGPHQYVSLSPGQIQWVKSADWYRGRPLQDKTGKESPNGNKAWFCTGSCFAVKTDAVKKSNIPDIRLGHNGGDWANGAALWQNGFECKDWTSKKQVVNWSATPRRGLSEKHPGL